VAKKKHQQTAEPPEPAAERPRIPGLLAGRPTVAGVIWLIAITLVIGVSAGYLASRFAGSNGPTAGVSAQDPATPWRARLLQDPQDVDSLLGLAHVELDRQRLDEAETLYRQVLSLQPKNVEAITHLGTVMLGRGQSGAALRQYNQALAIQPDYLHALWDKGSLQQQVLQDYPAAIKTWEAFLRTVGPESPDGKTAQQFIAEARAAMKKASPVDKAFGGAS
jgi:cytochrome c-type biogenesis protein CcmH/NrfG